MSWRDQAVARLCALAGVTPEGGIVPPATQIEIDRSEYTWWKNRMPSQKTLDRYEDQRVLAAAEVPPEDFAGCPSELPRRLLDTDSATRKLMPMASGLIDYFPDALASVANISHLGNQKHNPGQPLHWARGKSADHADCIARHLTERGGFDKEGVRHSAQLAWRALALLQMELEAELKLSLPRGAK